MLCSCGAEKNLKKAEKYLALGEYYDAATQFKQAYTKTSPKEREKRGQYALKMAYCYEKTNSVQKAVAAYRNAIRYNQADMNHRLAYARQLLKTADYKQAATEFKATPCRTTRLPRTDSSQRRTHRNGRRKGRDTP